MSNLGRLRRRLRRTVLARRRSLAAVLTALAVLAAIRATAAPLPPTEMIVRAAQDIPAGTVLTAAQLELAALPPSVVPEGAVRDAADVIGRTAAGPLRRGEPLTDVRVVQPSILAGYPGLVAAPVRVGDRDAAALLEVGDRIDLLAADPSGLPGAGEAVTVAVDATVLALPREQSESDFASETSGSGTLVVLAVTASTARRAAAAGVTAYLSVILKP